MQIGSMNIWMRAIQECDKRGSQKMYIKNLGTGHDWEGAYKTGGGGQVKFYAYKKGRGGRRSFSHAEGGGTKGFVIVLSILNGGRKSFHP